MSPREAVVALRRFGLGAKPGDAKRISSDPRGYVVASLADPKAAVVERPDLHPSYVVYAEAQEAQMAQALARALDKAAADKAAAASPPQPGAMAAAATGKPKAAPGVPAAAGVRRDALLEEQFARVEHGIATDAAFPERLVLFWSNHFCVSALKGPVRGLAGGFEREAIRPHVLGRFSDMLAAVEQHPAMLIFLDNQVSIGPNSQAGRNRSRGLNENLAREILELHTLGVDGGYTQEDVTNFARILTGWSVGNLNQTPAQEAGKFIYFANRHEPGEWTVAGKKYPNQGQATGTAVLADLARHPSTARHIAAKLARHFVSDTPPPDLVKRLETTFRDSDGDLKQVSLALVQSNEAWLAPPRKVVPPYDFTVSLARGLGLTTKAGELIRLAGVLGQPLWQVSSPKGWPDTDDAWMGPSAMRERLRIAEKAAREVPGGADPRSLADDLMGAALSDATRQAVARAETREQGFELLAMSPEFLRR